MYYGFFSRFLPQQNLQLVSGQSSSLRTQKDTRSMILGPDGLPPTTPKLASTALVSEKRHGVRYSCQVLREINGTVRAFFANFFRPASSRYEAALNTTTCGISSWCYEVPTRYSGPYGHYTYSKYFSTIQSN